MMKRFLQKQQYLSRLVTRFSCHVAMVLITDVDGRQHDTLKHGLGCRKVWYFHWFHFDVGEPRWSYGTNIAFPEGKVGFEASHYTGFFSVTLNTMDVVLVETVV